MNNATDLDSAEMAIGRGTFRLGIFKEREFEWGLERALIQMTANGSELGECFVATRTIRDGDVESWIQSWKNVGEKVESFGQESLKKGHLISARNAFLRAATYYRTAEYLCVPDHPDCVDLHFRGVKISELAAQLFDPPIQRVYVDFEGCKLPGYFWRPKNDDVKRPTIFLVGGNDSWLEELIFKWGVDCIARGYNVFIFDHPGHRGAVYLYPGKSIKRSDYELPYRAAFDLLETLPGVDDRICLNGYSHGGYISTRVACFEPRVTALVASSPIHDLVEINKSFLQPLTHRIPAGMDEDEAFDQFFPSSSALGTFMRYTFWTVNASNLSGYRKWLEKDPPVITSYLGQIKCPVLSICGEGEGEVMVRQAREVHAAVPSKQKSYHEFSLMGDFSDDHCQLDNRSRAQQVMFDWLDPIFKIGKN